MVAASSCSGCCHVAPKLAVEGQVCSSCSPRHDWSPVGEGEEGEGGGEVQGSEGERRGKGDCL